MYAAGGAESWNCLNSVERYNPENNTWTLVAPMNVARRGAGIAVHAGEPVAVHEHQFVFAFTHRVAGVSPTDWVLVSRCVGVLGDRYLVLICHILFRQTVCCWRLRWLPRTPLCGGVRPRPQRVEDAGQHDIFTQQCRSGHAGRNHLRRGWLRRQRVPQHDGGVQPRDGRVERLHQDPVCPL